MARLTDSAGRLLGGLDASPPKPPASGTTTTITAPAAPAQPPKHGPEELVIGLKCDYGSLAYLTFSGADVPQAAQGRNGTAGPRPCRELIEEANRRHDCPACGGSYCAAHADPDAHRCRSILRTETG